MHKQDDVLLIEFDPNNQVDVNMWRDQVNDFLKRKTHGHLGHICLCLCLCLCLSGVGM